MHFVRGPGKPSHYWGERRSMIRIATSLFCALVLTLFCASGTRAKTITSASCSSADVQAAINSSSSGDTVLVPGGSCTWSEAVTISSSQQIVLDGQGSTTINFAGSGVTGTGTVLTINAGTSASTFVTGFTFNGAFVNGACPITLNTSYSPMTQTFRFHHNTLSYLGGGLAGTFICIHGNGPGLLDHNTFTTDRVATEMIHNLGQTDGNNDWSQGLVPGSPNFIYLEDNTFTGPGGNYAGTSAIQNYYGARVVFRYNTLHQAQVDVHGTNPSPGACTVNNGRWFEIYNNVFHTDAANSNVSNFMSLRGGSGVVFNNSHPSTESNGGTGNVNITSDCQGGAYPVQDQIGRGMNQSASPVYIWNNTNIPISPGSSFVELSRDYFVSASQPSTVTRCESAGDASSGCPVSYNYVPYQYPHPLTMSGTAPSAPTGLTAVVQ